MELQGSEDTIAAMPADNFPLPPLLAGQALASFIVFAILLAFGRKYSKSYLTAWTRSWMVMGVFYLAGASSVLLSTTRGASSASRLLASMIGTTAGFFAAGFLFFGCYELAIRRPIKLRHARLITLALAGIGTTLPLFLLVLPDEIRFQIFLPVLMHYAAAAAVTGLSAAAVFRFRAQKAGAGFYFVATAMGLYAIFSTIYLGASLFTMARRDSFPAPYLASTTDMFLQIIFGLAMVICVLEDEREGALLAASQVEHLAYHDPLTGLPNRSLFFDRLIVALAHASRHKYKLAILYLDLDRFKQVNDSLGHSMGDVLLKTAAERMRGCVREEDTVARFGGDEFVVLIHIIGRVEDAGKIARKLLDALTLPFALGDRELVVSSSVGIAVYPSDGTDAEALVKNADTATYRAKHVGGDNYQFYAPAMNSRALEMLELESDLRKALKANELVLYYQPLIDLHNGAIAGLEALLRWNHPERGLLLPEKFISTAEISGLIIPIGNWVLREACRQAKFWQRQKGTELFVSVNLSARQFYQSDITEQVRLALEESRLNPKFLELEITETSAMQDVVQTVRILRELKSLGVRIAIDDFGTGYSSLSYLKEFPVDTLKLDQSFLKDLIAPQDAKIVSGVIAMAHSMSLLVLAEGVETLSQLDFLRNNECDRLQGFLFSRPLMPEAFDKYWTHHKQFTRIA